MVDNKYVGIDFGTTNCCISYTSVHPQKGVANEPQVVEVNGHSTIQNALAIGPDGHTVIAFGDDIYDAQIHLQNPESVHKEYKLELRENQDAQYYAAAMFGQLYAALIRSLNIQRLDPEKHQIVIGVPVKWTETENRIILKAAARGGLGGASPVPEPIGAMLYHAHIGDISFGPRPEYNLVLDFGGGTTDFVVLQMASHWPTPRVVHTYGDLFGGRDFDIEMMNYLRNRYWRGNNWKTLLQAQTEQFSRRFKERFSTAIARGQTAYEQMCGLPRFDSVVRLSRQEFESPSFGRPLLARFGSVLENGIHSSGLAPEDIRRIILSGGSSRWYFVEEIIREYFKDAVIIRSALPEQTIAKGLALYFVDPTMATVTEHMNYGNHSVSAVNLRPALSQIDSANQVSPFTELQRSELQSRPSPVISSTPIVIPQRKWTPIVTTWGFVAVFLLLINDIFIPVLGGTPGVPEETCLCGLPLWIMSFFIALFIDRNRARNQVG